MLPTGLLVRLGVYKLCLGSRLGNEGA